jgi:dGTPase
MRRCGGFDPHVQSGRVVTELERRYPRFDGLNLSWEVIEGLVKHNGPRVRPDGSAIIGQPVPKPIANLSAAKDLLLGSQPALEAQCAAIADDIAYDAHDIDDGLRAGLLDLRDLRDLPLTGPLLSEIDKEYPGLDRVRLIAELVRRLISLLVEDVLLQTNLRLAAEAPLSADAVRSFRRPLVAFTDPLRGGEAAIKQHLFERVYKNEAVTRVMGRAEAVVAALFRRYVDDLGSLPAEWRSGLDTANDDKRTRRVADFLAGMTDRFALAEYQRLFDQMADFG